MKIDQNNVWSKCQKITGSADSLWSQLGDEMKPVYPCGPSGPVFWLSRPEQLCELGIRHRDAAPVSH